MPSLEAGYVKDVTLVADTSQYADNDVLSVIAEITGVFDVAGGVRELLSVQLLDEDDQGVDIDILFFDATGTIGTINGAVNISDADARKCIGRVEILAANYCDLINSQVAHKANLGLMLKAAATSTSLFIASVVRSGTPTFSASGLKLKLGLR